MKLNRIITKVVPVALALLCTATLASAQVHVRGASGNGEDGNAPNWLLLGRSRLLTLTNNGKKANMRREIVCVSQDVENALPTPTLTLSGSCNTGDYMYVLQFQSTSTNLAVTLGNLLGFDPTNVNNFGVLICDSPNNTIELCTNDPTGTHIPNITATATTSSVTFTVPNAFPSYPAGTLQQGRGLTFYIITNQTSQLPMGVPTVGIH